MDTLQPMQYWDGGIAGAIILTGLVIVFVALIILIGVVQATGKLVGSAAAAPKPAEKPSAPVPVAVAAAPSAAPVVQQGIAGETVAAISAAVAAMMEEEAPGAAYSVASIQKSGRVSRAQRPVWGFAGMQQNTRPF